MSRYQRYLCRLIELSEKEIYRNRRDIAIRDLAVMYNRIFLRTRRLFENVYRRDLVSAFRVLMESGKVEIAASSATHAYLPALIAEPTAVKAQLGLAVSHFRKHFGKTPAGIWLPECGFSPKMDGLLKEAGLGYFFLESHGLLSNDPGSRRDRPRKIRY